MPGRGTNRPSTVQATECPYRGLEVFDEAHARFFFGREAVVQHLVEQLRSARFLAVIGPSGSGKSSVVRAGLLPRLRNGALPDSAHWTYLVLKPGMHPLNELAVSLASIKQQDNINSLRESLAASERELHLQTRLVLQAEVVEARVCLVVDQFEEVFTLCQSQEERTQFVDALRYAATVAGGQTVIILTMRADFVTRAADYTPFAELLSGHQFLISPMDQEDLRRAIEEPALLVGLTLEKGLTETILRDVGREPGLLPLMEDALLQLWEKRRADGVMTIHAYQEIGGVQGALAKKADTIFSDLSPMQQTLARRVLLRLTQPGEGTEDTRRRATLEELQTLAKDTGAVERVVEMLVKARLLVISGDQQKQQVDVVHETLIRGWPRLRGWIDEHRLALRTHRRLTEAAQEWQRLNRDEGILFRGVLLTQALEWREQHEADLNDLEREFLDASLTSRVSEEEKEKILQRRAEKSLWLQWILANAAGIAVASVLLKVETLVTDVGAVGGVGVAPWFILRRQFNRAGWWVLATVAGVVLSVIVIMPLSDALGLNLGVGISTAPTIAPSIIGVGLGLGVGVAQWFILRRQFNRAGRWVLSNYCGRGPRRCCVLVFGPDHRQSPGPSSKGHDLVRDPDHRPSPGRVPSRICGHDHRRCCIRDNYRRSTNLAGATSDFTASNQRNLNYCKG